MTRNRHELVPKSSRFSSTLPSLQYCRYLLYTVAAIFHGKPPYYQKLPPPFMWLAADRLRENYPHKSWRLKSRGVWPRLRQPRHGNVERPYDPAKTFRNISSYTVRVSGSFSRGETKNSAPRKSLVFFRSSNRYALSGIKFEQFPLLFKLGESTGTLARPVPVEIIMKAIRLCFLRVYHCRS